jgi:hypothetical protein
MEQDQETAPFTKYKFNMPIGSVTNGPAIYFADSMEEVDQFILYQMQKEKLFLYTLTAVDYEYQEDTERFKKVKETLLQSTIPVFE